MVSRLPDKGEKIQKQIGVLGTGEVEGNERNVIDLDDINEEMGEIYRMCIYI